MKKIDKLSAWLRDTVHGDAKSASSPKRKQGGKKSSAKKSADDSPRSSRKKASSRRKAAPIHKGVLRMIPVGGLEEVGKNCMIVEYERDIVVIDMGFQFPEDEMFGVDYVIPDIEYLKARKDRIRGILITHGHLDHIGGLPYVLEDLGFPPIYGLPLSLGLVKKQLTEHKLLKQAKTRVINNTQTFPFGQLKVDFFRVNHSIPDSVGMAISCPAGTMVHTGDFKFDFTPADGIEADIGKISKIGKQGVNIMFSDSTNATRPGHTLSESVVAENLEKAISGVKGRIIIACFSSLLGRAQQIIEFAEKHGRKVFLSGRSMETNVAIAKELGFIRARKGLVHSIRALRDVPDEQVLILTTGSQGEPMAALSRMAAGAHSRVKIRPGDTVVLSASPILGNEKAVAFLVDNLSRLGAKIVHNRIMDVHTSGHGNQEDLKMMMSLLRPDHFVPIHGNHYMRHAHGQLAPKVGIPEKNVHLMDNGNVIELKDGHVSYKKEDIKTRFVVVDGLGQGDLGSYVLKERETMAQNGVVTLVVKLGKGGRIAGKPKVSTRGFVYQKEMEKIVKEIEKQATSSLQKAAKQSGRLKTRDLEQHLKSSIMGLVVRKLNRKPLINVVFVGV